MRRGNGGKHKQDLLRPRQHVSCVRMMIWEMRSEWWQHQIEMVTKAFVHIITVNRDMDQYRRAQQDHINDNAAAKESLAAAGATVKQLQWSSCYASMQLHCNAAGARQCSCSCFRSKAVQLSFWGFTAGQWHQNCLPAPPSKHCTAREPTSNVMYWNAQTVVTCL